MVAAEKQGLVRHATSLVKLQVSNCRVKLFVLHDDRLCITKISKDLVIEEEASLIDTLLPLALAAHAKHWFESFEFMHFLYYKF